MKWNTYQDMENRAYSHILTTLFPEQTKTLPRILVWSIIFLVDLTVVIAGEFYLDLIPQFKLEGLVLLAAVLGLFWLQGYLWGIARKRLVRKKEFSHDAL